MARSLVLIAVLAGAALAADTTAVQVIVFGINSPWAGSVIHADPTATTFSINDLPDSSSTGLIVTQGPSTFEMAVQRPAATGTGVTSLSANCKLDPAKDEARCTTMLAWETISASVQTTMKYSELMRPVQITAGAEKLSSTGTNAAGPMVTQNAVWAGVAAVVGGVLAL